MSVSIDDVFGEIPKRFNGAAAGDWKADILFRFETDDGEMCRYVSVADGAVNVGEGDIESPTATIRTQAATWVGMVTGTVNPMLAFMSGKLRVEGNMGDVMKLQDQSIFPR
jgi:putative sterol carrier protein